MTATCVAQRRVCFWGVEWRVYRGKLLTNVFEIKQICLSNILVKKLKDAFCKYIFVRKLKQHNDREMTINIDIFKKIF